MNSKEFFVKSYGYLWVKLFKYDGLYWFKTTDRFLVAVEFLPPEYEPNRVCTVKQLDFIDGNIVASVLDGEKYIYNIVYTKHIEENKCLL
jgi:hypothetical protein